GHRLSEYCWSQESCAASVSASAVHCSYSEVGFHIIICDVATPPKNSAPNNPAVPATHTSMESSPLVASRNNRMAVTTAAKAITGAMTLYGNGNAIAA